MSGAKYRVFLSSVQKELAEERLALKAYIEGDALLSRFFDVFRFEELPASDRRADNVYLDEVRRCDAYMSVFGDQYGYEDAEGISPTEREFDQATAEGKTRLIFVKGTGDENRHPKMLALVRKAGDQLIRRRFTTTDELARAVYASLADHLDQLGIIQDRPFDERPCRDAGIDDVDADAVQAFVRLARAKRDFPLAENTPMDEVLTHLALLRDGKPTNAAVLLFGNAPQRFVPCAEIRCMHFHGSEIVRPAPFYRIFKGSLSSQVDEAANFVLSVTNVSVGTRALGPQAPVRLEIPRDVIQEAIVNAVVHRDYTSNAAIQVAVFSDRVEIWNPGELLPPLTPDSLRVPHRSITRNHRICEAMFLAGYIEKYGTGTLMMIRESVSHALPEPMFRQSGGEFVAVVGRDWLTEKVLTRLNLSDRQVRGLMHIKLHGRISNSTYRQIVGVSERTALRDLKLLADMGLLEKTEGTGRTAQYELAKAQPVINPPNPSSPPADETRHKPAKPATKGFTKGSLEARRKGDINGTSEGASAEPVSHASKPQVERNALRDTDIHDKRARQKTAQVGTKSAPSRHQVEAQVRAQEAQAELTTIETRLLQACSKEPQDGRSLLSAAGYSSRTGNFKRSLDKLLVDCLIEMTLPDKPRSSKQKYRLTDKGRQWLEDSHV